MGQKIHNRNIYKKQWKKALKQTFLINQWTNPNSDNSSGCALLLLVGQIWCVVCFRVVHTQVFVMVKLHLAIVMLEKQQKENAHTPASIFYYQRNSMYAWNFGKWNLFFFVVVTPPPPPKIVHSWGLRLRKIRQQDRQQQQQQTVLKGPALAEGPASAEGLASAEGPASAEGLCISQGPCISRPSAKGYGIEGHEPVKDRFTVVESQGPCIS